MLADACEQLGDRTGADQALERAQMVARTHGHRLQEAQALHMEAQIAVRRGTVEIARASATAALEVFREVGSMASVEDLLEFLAALP
jgi:ATP/maltotriose-dependent transcriptional regulator MalT